MAAGRRKSGRILILLALVLIVGLGAAALLLKDRLAPAGQVVDLATPTPNGDLAKIVVLAQPVSRGAVISEDVLASINYPRGDMIEGLFFTNTADVVGKRARFDLSQGVPLTPNLLQDESVGSMAAVQIPKGMVAISIPINRLSAVSYALQPGDRVNIISSMLLVDIDPAFQSRTPNKAGEVTISIPDGNGGMITQSLTVKVAGDSFGRVEQEPAFNIPVYLLPSEPQRPRMVSQTIVQDAMVLYVGEFPQDGNVPTPGQQATPTPDAAAAEAQGEQPQQPPRPDIITLVVSPQDAVTINYLLLTGSNMNLVMRSAGDADRIPTDAVTLQFILDQYNIPFPAKLPYGQEPRIDKIPSTLEQEPVGLPAESIPPQ